MTSEASPTFLYVAVDDRADFIGTRITKVDVLLVKEINGYGDKGNRNRPKGQAVGWGFPSPHHQQS